MKKASHLILLLSSAALMSCGGGNATCPTTSASEAKEAAKVQNIFVAEQKISYSNNRPKYNYYETTFTFEALELYTDSTYKLEVSSCTFSALILPEEGNQATGNAKAESLMSYYGKYTSVVDDLDDTGLNITFETPTRVAGFVHGSIISTNGVIDTDAWTAQMKKDWADVEYEYHEDGSKTELSRKEYDSGAAWLEAHPYALTKTFASTSNNMMDWIDIKLNLK